VHLPKRIALCPYEASLITCDEPIPDRLSAAQTPQTLAALFEAWRSIQNSSCQPSRRDEAWGAIWRIGEIVSTAGFLEIGKGTERTSESIRSNLWRFRDESASDHFFLLLTEQEAQSLLSYNLLFLCNLWQMERGHLPVHTAGVIRNGGMYLFAGSSGAGKSTAAALSQEAGGTILDEDQVLVHPLDDGRYTADAWGYNVRSCDVPLRAIFALVQTTEDRLIPLGQTQVARLLVDRQADIVGSMLSRDLLRRSFGLAAEIARCVPGYELHFRKSPAFWKLIDERFPG
jgi:hypothetical protein